MEQLARAIKLAMKYMEESWDETARKYKMTMREAADKGASEVGFDSRGAEPVYLLIQLAWDYIADWVEQFDNGDDG